MRHEQRKWKILRCLWSSVINDLKENRHYKNPWVNCKATYTSEWRYSSGSTSEVRGDLGRLFNKGSETRNEDKQREGEKHAMGEVDYWENGEDARKWSGEYTTVVSWN